MLIWFDVNVQTYCLCMPCMVFVQIFLHFFLMIPFYSTLCLIGYTSVFSFIKVISLGILIQVFNLNLPPYNTVSLHSKKFAQNHSHFPPPRIFYVIIVTHFTSKYTKIYAIHCYYFCFH